MFVEKGQGQHLNVTVKLITQSLDNALAHIIHEICLSKVGSPPQYVEYDDGKGEELQHPNIFIKKDFVQYRLDKIGRCCGQRCHQDHAQHGHKETKPL